MIRQMEDKDKNKDRIMRILKKFILNKIKLYHGESNASPRTAKMLKTLKRQSFKIPKDNDQQEKLTT
jgi:hypothetical protein